MILSIPKSLHSKFKAKCALEGISMSNKVSQLIKSYLGDTKSKKANSDFSIAIPD